MDAWNNPHLARIAAAINAEEAARSKMKVGEFIKHPDGYNVKVISGAYLRNGRVSNWWEWQRVNEDGTLGPVEAGYGW